MIQGGKEEELREGDIARRQLFAKVQDESTLHLKDDVSEPLGVGAELIGSIQHQLRSGGGVQRA